MKISILSLFRDSEKYIERCLSDLEILVSNTGAEFEFLFYENDSVDNTRQILKKWMSNKEGLFIYEDLNNPKFGSINYYDRFRFMSYYRNKILLESKPILSNYTILLDSDVIIDKNLVNKYLKYMSDDVAMLTSNTVQNINCKMTNSINPSYYDSIILFDKNNNHCMTWSSNPFYRKQDRDLWDNGLPVDVNRAFAGAAMIKSNILNLVSWDTIGNVEHEIFCDRVRFYGKILCIPTIINKVIIDENTLQSITDDHYQNVINFQKNKLNILYNT